MTARDELPEDWLRLQEFERSFGDVGDTANNLACVDFTEGMWVISKLRKAWGIESVPGQPYKPRY